MRKIIETTSTLALWAVWIIGSGFAISEFFFNDAVSKKAMVHFSLIAWSPVVAVGIFTWMLLAVRFSKTETVKKAIPSEHSVQWSEEDLVNAQNGKVVDLFFPAPGLTCHVKARDEVALVLHSDKQTIHLKVASPTVSESSWGLQKIVARSMIIIILALPQASKLIP
jgi:hypothetical protein